MVTHGGVIGAVERHLDAEWVRIPNLGGREAAPVADGTSSSAARSCSLDPDDVEVTTPRQI